MQSDEGGSTAGRTLDVVGCSLVESAIKKLENALILSDIVGDLEASEHINHALGSLKMFKNKYIIDE
jgi:hypothetical protein